VKPISVIGVISWALLAALAGFGYSNWAIANGFHIPVSGITLSVSVAVVAIILLVLVFPIWKYKRNLKKIIDAKDRSVNKILPVDPFYAVKVLLLARAASVTASLFIGWHAGVIVKQFLSPVIATEAIGPNLSAAIASLLLLAITFIVVEICKLPDDGNSPKSKSVTA
jgi:hypothetical protein